jgi:hypothetical protein
MGGARSQGLFGALDRGGLLVGGRSLTSSLNVEWCARERVRVERAGRHSRRQVAGGCMYAMRYDAMLAGGANARVGGVFHRLTEGSSSAKERRDTALWRVSV